MSIHRFRHLLTSALAMICLIAVAPSPSKADDALARSECMQRWGGIWNPQNAKCEAETGTRTACEQRGGKMAQAGRMGRFRCIASYADGGQPCTDSGQCKGKCLFMGDEQERPLPQPVVGQCSRNDNPFGCFVEVRDGKLLAGLCVD